MKTDNYKPNERNCNGLNNDLKPCPYIEECDLCIWFSSPGSEDCYIGRGKNVLKCKRDNPNYKPMTKAQFIEMLDKIPREIGESLEKAFKDERFQGMI